MYGEQIGKYRIAQPIIDSIKFATQTTLIKKKDLEPHIKRFIEEGKAQ